MNGFTENLFRARRRGSVGLLCELADQVSNQPGPTGLVRCAAATAIIAMEIFVEQDVILEVRIGLELLIRPKTGSVFTSGDRSCAQPGRRMGMPTTGVWHGLNARWSEPRILSRS